jgi:thymidylate synthase (FAD)
MLSVKLISYSNSVNASGSTLQDLVCYCARVSNPSNQHNTETNERLIKYLIKHKHWSPFEMASVCLEITTTRDIARQILRHRSFSFQEFSQRYADPTKDLSFTTRTARLQDPTNRQNSHEITPMDGDHHLAVADEWLLRQKVLTAQINNLYQWAIQNDIAKEQARAVLPEGLTVSRMYMNGSLRSWIHYIELRSGVETQKEHRIIARQCAEQISTVFPMIMDFVQQ